MIRLTPKTYLLHRSFRKLGEKRPTFPGTLLTLNTFLKRSGVNMWLIKHIRRGLAETVKLRYTAFDPSKKLFRRIQIQTQTGCNLSCPFCPSNKKGIQLPQGKMPLEVFKKIMGELHQSRFQGVIHLYLQNEPLLDKRLEQLARIGRSYCPNASIVIESNGILLTLDRFRALVHAGLDTVYVNNYTPERRDYFANYRYRDNIYTRLKPIESEPKYRRHVIINQNRSWGEELTNRAGNTVGKRNLKLPLNAFCLRPFDQLYIGYNGSALLCCQDWKFEAVMGNVTRQSLKEIWQSSCYQRVRKSLLRNNRRFSICERCDFQGWP